MSTMNAALLNALVAAQGVQQQPHGQQQLDVSADLLALVKGPQQQHQQLLQQLASQSLESAQHGSKQTTPTKVKRKRSTEDFPDDPDGDGEAPQAEVQDEEETKPFSFSYTFLCLPKRSIPMAKWKRLLAILEPRQLNGLRLVRVPAHVSLAQLVFIAGGAPPHTKRAELGVANFKELVDTFKIEYEERGHPLRHIDLAATTIRECAIKHGWKDEWYYGKQGLDKIDHMRQSARESQPADEEAMATEAAPAPNLLQQALTQAVLRVEVPPKASTGAASSNKDDMPTTSKAEQEQKTAVDQFMQQFKEGGQAATNLISDSLLAKMKELNDMQLKEKP